MARMFITGGAGFLGRALIRHFQDTLQVDVTVYSRDEAKHMKARSLFPDAQFIIGDIHDSDRLKSAIKGHDYVIHAAALKHVPQAETNVRETVRVNIEGSRHVFEAALDARVRKVISISTDKACRPVNVYGFTKKVMERLAQEFDTYSDTHFVTVRYGNVVGSTGSVIPIFEQQAHKRQLRITDPTMTRFWLPIQEAVGMVELALMEQERGTILVKRIPATDMLTVAKAAARHALGRSYEEDRIDFITTGHRFGEKHDEELIAREEVLHTKYLETSPWMEIIPIWHEPIRPPDGENMRTYYTSATPDQWLDEDAMLEMIKDSMGEPW